MDAIRSGSCGLYRRGAEYARPRHAARHLHRDRGRGSCHPLYRPPWAALRHRQSDHAAARAGTFAGAVPRRGRRFLHLLYFFPARAQDRHRPSPVRAGRKNRPGTAGELHRMGHRRGGRPGMGAARGGYLVRAGPHPLAHRFRAAQQRHCHRFRSDRGSHPRALDTRRSPRGRGRAAAVGRPSDGEQPAAVRLPAARPAPAPVGLAPARPAGGSVRSRPACPAGAGGRAAAAPALTGRRAAAAPHS